MQLPGQRSAGSAGSLLLHLQLPAPRRQSHRRTGPVNFLWAHQAEGARPAGTLRTLEAEITLPQSEVPGFLMQNSTLELFFFTRMLYSCLVDADFLDTESFMDGRSREHNETCMEQLWNKLQSYVSGWFPPKGN